MSSDIVVLKQGYVLEPHAFAEYKFLSFTPRSFFFHQISYLKFSIYTYNFLKVLYKFLMYLFL